MSIWSQLMALARRLYFRLVGALGGHDAQVDLLRKRGMRVGQNCRIYTKHFGGEPWLISIGDHCTITSGVRFVTHDGACWVLRREYPGLEDFGPIIVHENCFIGVNAVILPGVEIGPNAIIAAGAVVARDVPRDTVFGGVPAKQITTLEKFRDAKIAKPGAFDTPTEHVARRRYLEERFRDMLEDGNEQLPDDS
jgi:acetyltransferase-like isoleucine patch superfamily enzyme